MQLNVYAYGGGNPVGAIDPRGETAFVLPAFGGAAAVGTGAGATAVTATGIGAVGAALAYGAYVGYQAFAAPIQDAIVAAANSTGGPPVGSLPIDQTGWSGDHGGIKEGVGAGPADDVRISPDGDVWVKNPDGSWTYHGAASDYTGSGKQSGRRGKDRRKKWCP